MSEEDGGEFVCDEMWAGKVVVGKDGRLVTGQIPASARGVATSILQAFELWKESNPSPTVPFGVS